MTITKLVLLAMLAAVFLVAARVWWTIRGAERERRARRGRPPRGGARPDR